MNVRRGLRALAAAFFLTGGALAVGLPVGAQEEDPFAVDGNEETVPSATLLQYGWWNKAQQSPAGGNPTPPPPGAPADGIYVLYGPTGTAPPPAVTGPLAAVPPAPDPADARPLGPEAFGAVRYAVPPGAEAMLTLRFTPTSSSQPGGVNPDVGQLVACPVSTAWDPVQNGRYDSAPAYDCGTGVFATGAGDTVVFTLPASLAIDGVFDLALVPAGTQPYSLALAPPTDDSMTLTSIPEGELEEEFDPGDFEDPSLFDAEGLDDGSFDSTDLGDVALGDFDVSEFSSGDVASAPVGSPGSPVTRVAAPAASVVESLDPFDPNASRSERMMAVALLLGLGAALWWVGGQPMRPPRLLGSLGAANVVPAVVDARGIGRFAKVRLGRRPPRLF